MMVLTVEYQLRASGTRTLFSEQEVSSLVAMACVVLAIQAVIVGWVSMMNTYAFLLVLIRYQISCDTTAR